VLGTAVLTAAVGALLTTVPAPPAGEPWTVVEVVDGDTLHVAHGTTTTTVRLIGINAPESNECWSDEATEALAAFVGEGPVWLTSDTTDVDRYGRLLRYVTNADGDDAGAALVEQGAAIARSYPPDTANDERYALLQEAARLDGRGLWAADACGPSPSLAEGPIIFDIDIHPDAAGDDNVNLNDEWVRFTNRSVAAIDLEGWSVSDESASKRYTFADLVLPPEGAVTLFSGCGVDNDSERYWCVSGSAVWNNDGDTVFLRDPVGNIVVSRTY
jgi:micrococcal nuclease